tara:strand:+ start:828 stop:1049 length:222 start_codon:yes stop_codon:yes gene_type:complete
MEQNQQIDFSQTTEIKCEECENLTFRPVLFLRKVSQFISPDGQDHTIPMESMECAKCGHINKEFNPTPPVKTK